MQSPLPRQQSHRIAGRRPARAMKVLRLSPLARAVAMLGLLSCAPLLPAQTAPVLPGGLQVQSGQASLTTQGASMTVRNSPGAVLNWQSFNIGAGAGVYFDQASASSRVLNRVVGNDPSQIFGTLASNGQVWLLNPNGVLFGAGARVDVAGLVASTLRLNDNDFLAGRYRFAAADGDAATTVRNEGALATVNGGHVVLLGSRVENTGDIHTPGGQAALVAGRSVELVDTGLPHVVVRLREGAGEVLNSGRIGARGGRVDLHGAIVNQEGLVRADTLAPDAQGRIVLRASDTLTLGNGSVTAATAEPDAGADGAVGAGRGGSIDLLGRQVALVGQAIVDASGAEGGGTIRVGGGAQGRDASVPNARAVYIGSGAELRADTTGARGDGGSIIVWGDEATRAYGRFSARGGALGGDGGFVETSGGWLDARPAAMDLSASGGRAGQWLLDPFDLEIVSAGQDINVDVGAGPVFTSVNVRSTLTTATLAAALNAGTSVRVATGADAAGNQPGDITMNGATLTVAPPVPVTLTLDAGRDIVIDGGSGIASTASPLSLVLNAGASTPGSIQITDSQVVTRGGDITLRGATPSVLTLPDGSTVTRNVAHGRAIPQQFTSLAGVELQGVTLDLGTGTLAAAGYSGDGTGFGGAGVRIRDTEGASTITAGRIDLFGVGRVANFAVGVQVSGASTLTATQLLRIEGSGDTGVGIEDNGTLQARQIQLAGRSNQGVGLFVADSTLAAGAQLVLDGRSAGAGASAVGLRIFDGTVLQVSDAAAAAGSELRLRGENPSGGRGVVIEGGSASTGGEPTRLTANGAAFSIEGISAGATGLQLVGNAVRQDFDSLGAERVRSLSPDERLAATRNTSVDARAQAVTPGTSGLTLDARGATSVALRGQSSGGGTGLDMRSVELQGPSFAGRTTTLSATGALTLVDSLISGIGPVALQAQGAGVNGSLLGLADTTLTTGSALTIDGVATGGGSGVSLLGGNVLGGASVSIAGNGAGGPGVVFNAAGLPSRLDATAGNLTVDGGAATGVAPTVSFAGGWALRATGAISLLTRHAVPLAADVQTGRPTFTAGQAFVLANDSPGGLVIGSAAGPGVDASALSQALAGMPASATSTVQATVGNGTLLIDAALSAPSRLTLLADHIALGAGGSLTAGGSGDAIVLGGLSAPALASFGNASTAGAGALATPAGRWVMLLDDPRQATLGGLTADFTAFGLTANPWAKDAAGNFITPFAGNAFGFGITPATLTGSASDPATASTNHVLESGRYAVWVPMQMSTPTKSRMFDAAVALEGGESQPQGTLDWSGVSREEAMTLLAARGRYKQKVFAKGVYRVQEDPRLADAPLCATETDLETGKCVITEELKQRIQAARQAAAAATAPVPAPESASAPPRPGQRRVLQAELPGIQRKLALLIGVNKYDDSRVPELTGAVPDVRAVRALLEGRLGYETTVLENPRREDMLRAFNRLALQALTGDSVIVYYAGHGVVVPINGVETGFWLPSDVDAEFPATWLANADIARLVATVGARQLLLVSDSCYSGTLAGKERVQLGGGRLDAEDLLKRRAAVVMSSGGDEPVADSGRNGHSIFAWHFMRALEGLERWQVGGNLFERVRDAVVKDFPQTPQYGASRSAGHQGGTDYLFERRALEGGRP